VFGTNPLLWFIPVHTSIGDGLSFPRNDTAESAVHSSVQSPPSQQQQQTNEETSLLQEIP
jgi:hypothetical protein